MMSVSTDPTTQLRVIPTNWRVRKPRQMHFWWVGCLQILSFISLLTWRAARVASTMMCSRPGLNGYGHMMVMASQWLLLVASTIVAMWPRWGEYACARACIWWVVIWSRVDCIVCRKKTNRKGYPLSVFNKNSTLKGSGWCQILDQKFRRNSSQQRGARGGSRAESPPLAARPRPPPWDLVVRGVSIVWMWTLVFSVDVDSRPPVCPACGTLWCTAYRAKDSGTPGEGDILWLNYWRDDRESVTKCGYLMRWLFSESTKRRTRSATVAQIWAKAYPKLDCAQVKQKNATTVQLEDVESVLSQLENLDIFPRGGKLWNFGGTHKIHKRFLTECTGRT